MGNNKQREIYEFLKEYTENCGYPPTVREICEAVSLKSTSTVQGHLERLQNKGLIKRNPLKPRALEITELSIPKREMIGIPIIREYKENIDLLDRDCSKFMKSA
ncbi:SOS-response transcriptional repressor LexA [Clostridium butyricum]|nr:SOS-response transcriptional repressor LexA [Clostridium butyricum]